jgi:hypothetical protein
MPPSRKPSRCASTGCPPWNGCSSASTSRGVRWQNALVTVSATRPARPSYCSASSAKIKRPAGVLDLRCRSNLSASSVGMDSDSARPGICTSRFLQSLGQRRIVTTQRRPNTSRANFAVRSLILIPPPIQVTKRPPRCLTHRPAPLSVLLRQPARVTPRQPPTARRCRLNLVLPKSCQRLS